MIACSNIQVTLSSFSECEHVTLAEASPATQEQQLQPEALQIFCYSFCLDACNYHITPLQERPSLQP